MARLTPFLTSPTEVFLPDTGSPPSGRVPLSSYASPGRCAFLPAAFFMPATKEASHG